MRLQFPRRLWWLSIITPKTTRVLRTALQNRSELIELPTSSMLRTSPNLNHDLNDSKRATLYENTIHYFYKVYRNSSAINTWGFKPSLLSFSSIVHPSPPSSNLRHIQCFAHSSPFESIPSALSTRQVEHPKLCRSFRRTVVDE